MRFLIIFIFLISNSVADETIEIKNLVIYDKLKKYDAITFLNTKNDELNLDDYKGNLVLLNFWATWCAPCIKEIPYYEELNKNPKIDVLLVSLDFPNHIYSRLIPFIKKNKIQSEVILLNDSNENYFISEINSDWSGALPATIIYNKKKREFFEKSFTKDELFKLVKNF